MPTPKEQPAKTTVKTRRPTKALPAQDLPSPEGMNSSPERLDPTELNQRESEAFGAIREAVKAVFRMNR